MSTVMKAGEMREGASARGFIRNNGLSLAVLTLFVAFLIGQTFSGLHQFNQEQYEHGEVAVSLGEYLTSGHFIEATAENWESEFLQMAFYVLLTSFLFQKGSSESKKIGEREAVDRDPRRSKNKK